MASITAHDQAIERIGRIVASSKLKYTWTFVINDNNFTLHLYHSKLSGKYEVRINGKQYLTDKGKSMEDFKYIARLEGVEVKLIKPNYADTFHLFIDHRDFNDMTSNEQHGSLRANESPIKSGDSTKCADGNSLHGNEGKTI